MVPELAILIRRRSPVCLGLIHVRRTYLVVWLWWIGVVVPGLSLVIIGHQGGMLQLTVPRLRIVLVNRIDILVR